MPCVWRLLNLRFERRIVAASGSQLDFLLGSRGVHIDGNFLDFGATASVFDFDGQDVLTEKAGRRFVKCNIGRHFQRQASLVIGRFRVGIFDDYFPGGWRTG